MFFLSASPSSPSSSSCFADSASDRTLPDAKGYSHANSPALCSGLCAALGFPHSGREFGRECYCGAGPPREDRRLGSDAGCDEV